MHEYSKLLEQALDTAVALERFRCGEAEQSEAADALQLFISEFVKLQRVSYPVEEEEKILVRLMAELTGNTSKTREELNRQVATLNTELEHTSKLLEPIFVILAKQTCLALYRILSPVSARSQNLLAA